MDERGSFKSGFPVFKCIQCPPPGLYVQLYCNDIDVSVYMVQNVPLLSLFHTFQDGSNRCSTDLLVKIYKQTLAFAISFSAEDLWEKYHYVCKPMILPAAMKLEKSSAYLQYFPQFYHVQRASVCSIWFSIFDRSINLFIHPSSILTHAQEKRNGSGWNLRGTGLSFANRTWKRPSMAMMTRQQGWVRDVQWHVSFV